MAIKREQLYKRLERIKDLPTLPIVLQKLNAEMRNPNAGMDKIAAIIHDDPSMMTRILKIVNSPLYSAGQTIHSLQLAVTRMGMNAVRNIALATSVFSAFERSAIQSEFDRIEFWKHSISTGVAMHVLYNECRSVLRKRYASDMLHLVGLLHDIGKIVFVQYFNDDFTLAIHFARDHYVPLIEAEKEMLGAGHTEIGAWLGSKWRLGSDLISTVLYHHNPECVEGDERELVEMCYYANAICNLAKLGDGADPVVPSVFERQETLLKIDPERMPDIIRMTKEEADRSELLSSLMS